MNTETTAIKMDEHRLWAGRMPTLRACTTWLKGCSTYRKSQRTPGSGWPDQTTGNGVPWSPGNIYWRKQNL